MRKRNVCQGSVHPIPTWKKSMYWTAVKHYTFGTDGRLALMEMRIVLASLIWHYDFEMTEGMKKPVFNHKTISAGELEVRISRRRVEA